MISLLHETIFVHIPKCAGQSVEQAFLSDFGLDWKNHRHLLGCFEKPPSWCSEMPQRLAHLSASEYVSNDFISHELFDSFYKFSIVRDPIDRSVSMWNQLGSRRSFKSFIKRTLAKRVKQDHYWFRSQRNYLCETSTGRLLVDDVIPFSRIGDHWPRIMRKTALKSNLPHRNRSKKVNPEIDEDVAATIKKIYADDYEYFLEF